MIDPGEEEARDRLRERLGAGARYDSPAAPARDLLWARRGTAYFARKLNELSDNELDAPSRVPGWGRRHVIAQVSYHARGLARLAEAARNGAYEEVLAEPENQTEDVEFGATLPAHALRHLFRHSEVHLNVEWRDLTEAGWNASVRSLAGDVVPIAGTPWLRAREIWLRALDLDCGGSVLDIPAELRTEIDKAKGAKG
jgi:maleylpyruvate isomerase